MNQNKKENLMNKTMIDLKEMLERENKLLANRKFIERLKDKGEKIRKLRDEIERVIKIKESVEETESFLAKLNLGERQQILPKHPMFSANKDDLRLAKQSIKSEDDGKEVLKQIVNGDLDIFSVAISRTFNEELSQKRSERFILNRLNKKSVQKNANKREDKQGDRINDKEDKKGESTKSQQQNPQDSKSELNNQQLSKKSTGKVDLFAKYKDTALEPIQNKNKVLALTIESSLEFGKEQKLKDYEVEKIKLEKRLTWRNIRQFDTDESESSDSDVDDDFDDE